MILSNISKVVHRVGYGDEETAFRGSTTDRRQIWIQQCWKRSFAHCSRHRRTARDSRALPRLGQCSGERNWGCERGDAGCYEEDCLPQRGAGPGRSPGTDMGGDDGDHGPQTTSPIYKVSEGGSRMLPYPNFNR